MAKRLQIRRDSTSNWTSSNPTLAEGEIGWDTTLEKGKVGDGTTAWLSLSFSIFTQAELDAKAPLASPALTGTPTAPTAAADTNTTQVATTAFVINQGYLKSSSASTLYATIASPALTGVPTAPTAASGTSTTQIATTAFVQSAVSPRTPVSVSGNSYTFQLTDAESTILTTSASPVSLTVPPESTTNFPLGTSINILPSGAGQVSFVAGSGVTIQTIANGGALKSRFQYQIISIYKYASDTWVALGDLVV